MGLIQDLQGEVKELKQQLDKHINDIDHPHEA